MQLAKDNVLDDVWESMKKSGIVSGERMQLRKLRTTRTPSTEPTIGDLGITRYRFDFPNCYGASVIHGEMLHIEHGDFWEIAVLKNGSIDGSTSATNGDDIVAFLTDEEVEEYLHKIEALPIMMMPPVKPL